MLWSSLTSNSVCPSLALRDRTRQDMVRYDKTRQDKKMEASQEAGVGKAEGGGGGSNGTARWVDALTLLTVFFNWQ